MKAFDGELARQALSEGNPVIYVDPLQTALEELLQGEAPAPLIEGHDDPINLTGSADGRNLLEVPDDHRF